MTYHNITGKPIMVFIDIIDNSTLFPVYFIVDNTKVVNKHDLNAQTYPISVVIPINSSYRLEIRGANIMSWCELR